jgi:hypothetical protein
MIDHLEKHSHDIELTRVNRSLPFYFYPDMISNGQHLDLHYAPRYQ